MSIASPCTSMGRRTSLLTARHVTSSRVLVLRTLAGPSSGSEAKTIGGILSLPTPTSSEYRPEREWTDVCARVASQGARARVGGLARVGARLSDLASPDGVGC